MFTLEIQRTCAPTKPEIRHAKNEGAVFAGLVKYAKRIDTLSVVAKAGDTELMRFERTPDFRR